MKKAKVLHNPDAGEGDTSEPELVDQIRSAGFECSYSSTKPFRWEKTDIDDADFLILAGGDGTVRKIAGELLHRKVIERNPPIALLPLGTANNIAATLGLARKSRAELIQGWHDAAGKKFDIGSISGLDEPSFFLESFGCGLFPKLMYKMKKEKKNDLEDPGDRLQAALEILHDLILSMAAKKCSLTIDGKDYSDEFLLLEVMNIRSFGPNLTLAPEADPGDGEFDVVFITEKERDKLAEYVNKKMQGQEVLFDFPVVKARDITMSWEGKYVHVDDKYHKLKETREVRVEMRAGLLEFLLPVR